jgi:transposase
MGPSWLPNRQRRCPRAARTTDLREVVIVLLGRLHSGCTWHALPHDLPTEGTVRDRFRHWRRSSPAQKLQETWRRRVRQAEGRDEQPSAGILDRQSARGTRTSGSKGYNAGK